MPYVWHVNKLLLLLLFVIAAVGAVDVADADADTSTVVVLVAKLSAPKWACQLCACMRQISRSLQWASNIVYEK